MSLAPALMYRFIPILTVLVTVVSARGRGKDPRAKQLKETDNWDLSLIEEIRQSGFVGQLYRK